MPERTNRPDALLARVTELEFATQYLADARDAWADIQSQLADGYVTPHGYARLDGALRDGFAHVKAARKVDA